MCDYVTGTYSENEAHQIFDCVFNEKVKHLLGRLNYNDLIFDCLYQKSITKTRTVDTSIFATVMCGFMTTMVAIIAIHVTFQTSLLSNSTTFPINIEAFGNVSIELMSIFLVAVMIVIWHLYVSRRNQEREFKDLLRETIQRYLNDKTMSPYNRRKLHDEWKKVKI